MKKLLFSLSLTVALLGAACQLPVKEHAGIVFRVTKIERRTGASGAEGEYLQNVFWITCVAIEPRQYAGMDFRFGCEKMPSHCTFRVGAVYRAKNDRFVSFEDWTKRYEAVHIFAEGADEVVEVGTE